jgi:hypothetical protein
MALVATLEGELALWLQILQIQSLQTPYLHLIGAPHTPVHTDTIATLAAVELAVAGYVPVPLTNPAVNWSFSLYPPPGPYTAYLATYIPITWTFGGACTVYGYYVSGGPGTVSLWAEAQGPFIFTPAGGTFTEQLQPWLASQPSLGTGVPCLTP